MSVYEFQTNNVPRHLLTVDDLTTQECNDLDETHLRDTSAWFFRYRGDLIPMADIMVAPDDLKAEGYDGYSAWSIGNGIAVRIYDRDGNLIDGGDSIVVAAYTCGGGVVALDAVAREIEPGFKGVFTEEEL